MRKDGCCGVQLGKIMNEVDRGWRRPSLKRNGSQQRDGDIDPSVTFSPLAPLPPFLTNTNSDTHFGVHIIQITPTYTLSLHTHTPRFLKHLVHLFLSLTRQLIPKCVREFLGGGALWLCLLFLTESKWRVCAP